MWFKDKNAFVGKRFRTAADSRELLELHALLGESFAVRAESRDGRAKGHIQRVKQLTGVLVRAMLENAYPDFTAEYGDNMILASAYHDIGKIAVNDEILNKSDDLTDKEGEKLKSHTLEGEKLLAEIAAGVGGGTYIALAASIARSHHERWNGCGYPDRLKGSEIPLGARVVSIADGFDCLASGSVYSKKFDLASAANALREFAGVYYDPALTDIFLSRMNKIEEVYQK